MVTMMYSLDEGAYPPVRAHETDAGADIRTPVAFELPPWSGVTVHTGVHIQLPDGTVGILKSKSGLNVRSGITGEGVIDEGYTGEIVVKLYNNTDTGYLFDAGDKVIQMLVMPVLYPKMVQVDMVEGGERGDSGFGSTGR